MGNIFTSKKTGSGNVIIIVGIISLIIFFLGKVQGLW